MNKMEINKDRSKKIRKLLAISLAVDMMLSMGIDAKAEVFKDSNHIHYSVEEQIKYHNEQHKLQEMIQNLSEDLYDKEYNDYCDNGTITINGVDYSIKYLHIEYGYIGHNKIVYLKDYHNPNVDIITGKIIDKDYVRVKVMKLKYADVFYNYCKDSNENKNLEDYINDFDGEINYMVPETYFYNLLNNGEKAK